MTANETQTNVERETQAVDASVGHYMLFGTVEISRNTVCHCRGVFRMKREDVDI